MYPPPHMTCIYPPPHMASKEHSSHDKCPVNACILLRILHAMNTHIYIHVHTRIYVHIICMYARIYLSIYRLSPSLVEARRKFRRARTQGAERKKCEVMQRLEGMLVFEDSNTCQQVTFGVPGGPKPLVGIDRSVGLSEMLHL